ncbi:hypothetical protein OIU78_001342 [Salix suchowensis]|nr:hypothetical protein OIU78_001342 [Salix suchowensis]
MKQTLHYKALLLFLLVLVHSSKLSARFLLAKQGRDDLNLKEITSEGTPAQTDDSELITNRRVYDFLVFLDQGPLVSPERWRDGVINDGRGIQFEARMLTKFAPESRPAQEEHCRRIEVLLGDFIWDWT